MLLLFVSIAGHKCYTVRRKCIQRYCYEMLTAHKTQTLNKSYFACFNRSDDAFMMLINVKMPTIVDIFTFMTIIFTLS